MKRVDGGDAVVARGCGEGQDSSTTVFRLERMADIPGSRPGICCSCETSAEINPRGVKVLDEVHSEGEEAECWDFCSFLTIYVKDWVAHFQVGDLK